MEIKNYFELNDGAYNTPKLEDPAKAELRGTLILYA